MRMRASIHRHRCDHSGQRRRGLGVDVKLVQHLSKGVDVYVLGNVSNRARRGFNVSKMKVSGGWRIGIEMR